jgi:DNA replication protein DnaC
MRRYTFADLVAQGAAGTPQRARCEQQIQAAKRFAEAPEGWLVLAGESGSGKTHIAAAIANQAIAEGRPALFLTVPDLLDHLRSAFAPDAEQAYDRLFEQVRDAPLLVLDDLGVQSPTPWAEEKVYQIINYRFNCMLPTVFTVAGKLENLDERVRSRLGDGSLARTLLLESERALAGGEPDPLALPLVREMTFQTFNYRPTGPDLPDQVARKLQHAFNAARNFALNPEGWLVLAGETGCGKTHLAAAVAHQQRAAGRPYLFLTVPDLLDRLRGEISAERSGDGADYIERVQTCPFLVLDDLGVHNDTAWAQEKLFQILNHRYNAKLPTVITIRPSEELPAAVRSRLFDDKVSQFMEIDAPDYRNPERPRNVPARRGRGAK